MKQLCRICLVLAALKGSYAYPQDAILYSGNSTETPYLLSRHYFEGKVGEKFEVITAKTLTLSSKADQVQFTFSGVTIFQTEIIYNANPKNRPIIHQNTMEAGTMTVSLSKSQLIVYKGAITKAENLRLGSSEKAHEENQLPPLEGKKAEQFLTTNGLGPPPNP